MLPPIHSIKSKNLSRNKESGHIGLNVEISKQKFHCECSISGWGQNTGQGPRLLGLRTNLATGLLYCAHRWPTPNVSLGGPR